MDIKETKTTPDHKHQPVKNKTLTNLIISSVYVIGISTFIEVADNLVTSCFNLT